MKNAAYSYNLIIIIYVSTLILYIGKICQKWDKSHRESF